MNHLAHHSRHDSDDQGRNDNTGKHGMSHSGDH